MKDFEGGSLGSRRSQEPYWGKTSGAGATVAFNEIRGVDSWRLEELEDVH